jgi:hypothetical protein
MKNANSTLSIILFLVTALLQMQNAVSQVSIERLKLPATSDSITKILEDEVTGRVIRIFTKFDKTHLTKNSYVKGMPSIQSGFILEDGQKITLPISETIDCIRNNNLITSSQDVIEYKTVFTFYQLADLDGNVALNKIGTIISNGDCSGAIFINDKRILIEEASEGGVETLLQLFDNQLNLIKGLKPYKNCNVTGSSYAIIDDVLYYSCEPDEYDENNHPSPKIMMINTLNGEIIKEKEIENSKHGLQISICEKTLIGNYYNLIYGFDLNLNAIWNRDDIIPADNTFERIDTNLIITYSIQRITVLDNRTGKIIWEKGIDILLNSKKAGSAYDLDYEQRIYKIKGIRDTNAIVILKGGYLKTDKHNSNKPLISNPTLVIVDSQGVIMADYPVEFSEVKPVLISNQFLNKGIKANEIHESKVIKINENK